MRLFLLMYLVLSGMFSVKAQQDTCIFSAFQHQISSSLSEVERKFWVSLPMNYDSNASYPVLYVLDGEWRFNLVQQIAYDLGGNRIIPHHIIVGIPHVDWREQRGKDLTFSLTTNEYDNSKPEAGAYTAANTGEAALFYRYLTEELIPTVDARYGTNDERVLIGHSYGGYFASYILPTDTYFSAYQIYDPSIWYSEGEAIAHFQELAAGVSDCRVFLSYQPVPDYHAAKILELGELLKQHSKVQITLQEYPEETHNSLYMYSVIDGLRALYADFRTE